MISEVFSNLNDAMLCYAMMQSSIHWGDYKTEFSNLYVFLTAFLNSSFHIHMFSRPGCSMPEIWDVEDPANSGKIPLCTLMSKDSMPYFITVFENSNYRVLKIPKE